ncbi:MULTISPECIES: hypothetical protein [unclassified Stygiolobus]|uniref:hypothetical protein n=1 Tax=unclassified Stygiolobus TaxID=2824672 RepID=UPI00307DC1B7
MNDYKALRNTSLTPPSYIHALHKEKLPSMIETGDEGIDEGQSRPMKGLLAI